MNEETNILDNSEIDKALKEFEAKNPEQAQKVSEIPKNKVEGIQFEIPSYGAMKYYQETDTPKIVKLVMKLSGGAIKEQKQAEWILLGFVVVAIGISVFLVFNPLSGGNYPKLDSTALNKLMQTPPAEIPSINR